MFDDELKIFYSSNYDLYKPGSFESVPSDAVAAKIIHSFSKLKSNKITNVQKSYGFFVGKVYSVNDLLNYKFSYSTENMLKKFMNDGNNYVLIPNEKKIEDRCFYSFNVNYDKAFSNFNKFKDAIQSIDYGNLNNKNYINNKKLCLNRK